MTTVAKAYIKLSFLSSTAVGTTIAYTAIHAPELKKQSKFNNEVNL